MKLNFSLSLCTKIYSKWIKDLNIIYETINNIEENTGAKLIDLGCTEHLMNVLKSEINKGKK